ncbi:MAG TPA: ribonuclease Z [Dictyobacter sp.]|jgi:ribonuclease BN (tRNA processing enzyme)|nr:ribonuclease Z [Dictyobacter sp.]
MSNITLLGTGTCQIEFQRRASSVLLDLAGTPILFDCGHGVVQRLLEAGVQHNQLHHIILSHFHPDHVSDLIPFLQAGAWSQQNPRTEDIHIYGPAGVQKLVNGLMDIFGQRSLQQPTYQVVVHEITADTFSIAGHQFEFISLPPSGNHGLRFTWKNKQYAITGDSHFHDEEIAFLRQVDLAIIDAGHPTNEEIVKLAAASQAHTIVCSHQYRELDAKELQTAAAQKGYQGNFIIARDMMSFSLD